MSNQTTINGITVSWEGDTLQDKLNALSALGIQYTPTSQELTDAADFDTIKAQVKAEYLNMIARLGQIQSATNPTNAQVIQAIKDLALYEERIMRVIKIIVT
jgi:hypothetical protein